MCNKSKRLIGPWGNIDGINNSMLNGAVIKRHIIYEACIHTYIVFMRPRGEGLLSITNNLYVTKYFSIVEKQWGSCHSIRYNGWTEYVNAHAWYLGLSVGTRWYWWFDTTMAGIVNLINEPRHEISNNVVCATSKGSDQPTHTRSLIRAFSSRLNILWILSYWRSIIWSF